VLVGVIMMVLALTILGLSLFSLSSYEAQFMNRSLDAEQAFHSAMGGLDRARFALTVAPESLANVRRNLPFHDVTAAVAKQVKGGVDDSVGLVQFGGNDVRIRVTAEYRGVSRTVEGSYHAQSSENYYKRVLTVSGGIVVNDSSGPLPPTYRCGTVDLSGAIWQSPADSSWKSCAGSVSGGIRVGGVPIPAVGPFITARAGSAFPLIENSGSKEYRMWGPAGQVRYYYADNPGDFSLEPPLGEEWKFSVRGRAVLLLPDGLRFDRKLEIKRHDSDPNACLVIVAQSGYSPFYPDPAIWFFNSVSVSEIPLVLVTDGRVIIEHFDNMADADGNLGQLSVFANNVWLTGPKSSSAKKLTMRYTPSMNAVIDTLMARDALPNATGPAGAQLSLRPGTWRVVH